MPNSKSETLPMCEDTVLYACMFRKLVNLLESNHSGPIISKNCLIQIYNLTEGNWHTVESSNGNGMRRNFIESLKVLHYNLFLECS